MTQAFDVVVIGAGPGGYIAAVRAAQLGLKTACIEGWKNAKGELALGGTCLNVGCIPSKALLASSEEYEKVSHHLDAHGIAVSGATIDIGKMQARKDAIVTKMVKGVEYLFKKNKITWLQGFGKFTGGGDTYKIAVGSETVEAKHVIVATGSKARHLPGVAVDNEFICDNEGALAFPSAPKRLGVIGAGVIGLELGSVWRRLGSEVTILEALPNFLGACDDAVAKEAWKQFRTQGLAIHLGVKIGEVTKAKAGITVEYTDDKGAAQKLECDRLVVSVGACPTPTAWAPAPSASRSINAASSRWTSTAAPTCPMSSPSATWCAGRCSRTRPRTRACSSPRSSPARSRTSTTTASRGSSTPRPRSPGSARPRARRRPRGSP
jgi:dihydrolipoamide dehydrogenase